MDDLFRHPVLFRKLFFTTDEKMLTGRARSISAQTPADHSSPLIIAAPPLFSKKERNTRTGDEAADCGLTVVSTLVHGLRKVHQ